MLVVENEGSRIETERSWQNFTSQIHPLPLESLELSHPIRVENPLDIAPGATAAASLIFGYSHPDMGDYVIPERGRISLSSGFFQRSISERAKLLLHEVVHVRLFSGRLRDSYRAIREAESRPDTVLGIDMATPGFTFMWQRRCLAFDAGMFCHEVGVDKFIHAHYPQLFTEMLPDRSRFYLGKREAHNYTDLPPQLAVYLTFYRLLRAELGLLLVSAGKLRVRLQSARNRYEAELRASVNEGELGWFSEFEHSVLSIAIATDEADPNTYMGLFERVLAVPVPEGTSPKLGGTH